MNGAESAALQLVCKERGWTEAESGESADLVLINTCSVRNTAERRTMGRLALYAAEKRKRRAAGGNFALVVAGCMAERLGDRLKAKVPEVDFLMGTASRSVFPLILEAVEKAGTQPSDSVGYPAIVEEEKPVFGFSSSHLEEGRFRSFVPVMHGCDSFCSYCIVPYVRGREVSRDPAQIREELALVASRGVKEITLLGQNVNTYDWNGGQTGFAELLHLVAEEAEKHGIRWLRFLSANPRGFPMAAVHAMARHPGFCRHLHLCVQHGSDRLLKAMNRGYSRRDYLELVAAIRRLMPGITLSTDIMVGFPGETEDDVRYLLSLMEEVRFLYAYIDHYNPMEGTVAFRMPDRIAEDVKRERLARVMDMQKGHTAELLRGRVGQRATVLVEGLSRKNADELVTRTERDEMVVVPGPGSAIGSFANLTLTGLRGNTFRAKELETCPGD
ncbi:MAG: tRNA (N6-isopentenyl adenosine(37)-C2)-methylthiotransferase MiaB [Treponema sp.]|nr:tRNA (N6-isopentenyl adenosine(37)-C2)-methylthiotransferase MiaB [Treponema sp.]